MKNFILNFLNDFKQNYKTLILAFIIAAALWMVVSVQVFPTIETEVRGITIEAPLTEYMVQNNLQIVNDITDKVDIKIQGKRYDISGLSASDFFASVDLSSVRSAGSITLPLDVDPRTDRDCKILEKDPLVVTLQIDKIITKTFPITGTAPDISLPDGFYASSSDITTTPETISITGSAAMIDQIKSVEARSTLRGEINESMQTGSEIIIYGSNGAKIVSDNLKLSSEVVTVNVPVYRQKELPLKLSITNYPSNFDINSLKYDIQPSSITVAAPDSTIDNISELDVGVIDIQDVSLSKNTYLPISLPEGYRNLSGNNNARIVWKTENYGVLDFTVSADNENIKITNAPDNFDISLITRELSLTVIGPSEQILNIGEGDLTVTVNLLGVNIREGAQEVNVSAQIRGYQQKCWVSGEYKVTINATL